MLTDFETSFNDETSYIDYLRTYPKDGKHLILHTDLPCSITKGSDPFWFRDANNEDRESQRQFWYVSFDHVPYNIPTKGFLTVENAYKYALSCYINYLDVESNRCHDILINLNLPPK